MPDPYVAPTAELGTTRTRKREFLLLSTALGVIGFPALSIVLSVLRHRGFPKFLLMPSFYVFLTACSLASGLLLMGLRDRWPHLTLVLAPFLTVALVALTVAIL